MFSHAYTLTIHISLMIEAMLERELNESYTIYQRSRNRVIDFHDHLSHDSELTKKLRENNIFNNPS